MPIYEFICKKCGNHFELLFPIGGEKNVRCVSCASREVKKLFSSFGIGGSSNRLKSSRTSCQTCTLKSCSTCR